MFHLESAAVRGGEVIRVEATEAMNALPRWVISLLCEEPLDDVDALVGAPARLHAWDEQEGFTRRIDLVIVAVADEGEARDGHRVTISLAAPESALGRRSGYRVFLDKTVPDIVAEALRTAGVPADRLVLRLATPAAPRRQCSQYAETEWAFIERILAEEGISYWLDDVDGRGVVVLGDTPQAHEGIVPPVSLPYDDESGMVRGRALSGLELSAELCPTGVSLRDFDVRNPDVHVDAHAGAGPLSVFEYPSFVVDPTAAQARAKARLEQLQRFATSAACASDCLRAWPGRVLRLEGCADERMNGPYLIVAVEHVYQRPSPDAPEARAYHNRLTLVPHGEVAFRPAPPAQAPRIEGIESAVTTGPKGEEIHVDDLGRVKLRFLWDAAGITDDRSSAWARCLQWPLGGAMLLPRVGWEVPVAYLDGDPDRPFVLGRLYNATAVVPFALPGAAASTAFKSATSPGGGSTNEIRMDDRAGAQEMAIHASKDQSVSVGGSSKATIGADQTHDVGLMLANVVQGSQTWSVAAMQSIDVGTSFVTAAKGSATLAVGGAELLGATGNRGVAAGGAYTELVGAAYALQCNQSNIQVAGKLVQANGGASILTAGISVSETVAGARAEVVGGAYSLVGGSSCSDTTYGAKRIQAGGAASESAGGAVETSARLGKVKAGTVTIDASGKLAISGANIVIQAASITAGAMSVSGGALKGTKGTTKVAGSVVKALGGGKLE